jgi:hypothetical protein
MLVNKNNMNIQVPAGKAVAVVPDHQSHHSATTGSVAKEQQAVSTAAAVDSTSPTTRPPSKEQQVVLMRQLAQKITQPFDSKNICCLNKTDKDSTPILCDIMKLSFSKKVKSVEDLLKVLNYNDATTSHLLKSLALPSNLVSRSKPGASHDGFVEFCKGFESKKKKKS